MELRHSVNEKDMNEALLDRGFQTEFVTMEFNASPQWHRNLEILYILTYHAVVGMDGKKYCLEPLDFIVIDSGKVHDVVCGMPRFMGICIRISKKYMRKYIPDLELLKFSCNSESITEETQEAYMKICGYMKELTVLYMENRQSYALRCNGIVLEILAELVDHFSEPMAESMSVTDLGKFSRMEEICNYVEDHYMEAISLQDAAETLGLNKDYFCRFFKHNMGISFINYLNRVRISHIYQDLIHTDESIQEIIERHGFLNQKLFYQKFKEIYGCTPRELRRVTKDNPYIQ